MAIALSIGDDLLVVLTGGSWHIGKATMSEYRKSLYDVEQEVATSSAYTYLGHKEDVIVKELSETISKDLKKRW